MLYVNYDEEFDVLIIDESTKNSVNDILNSFKNTESNIDEKDFIDIVLSDDLDSKKEKMDLEKKGKEQYQFKDADILEEDVAFYCNEIEKILENNIENLSGRTKNLLISHSEKINSFLSVSEKSEILLNNKSLSESVENVINETIIKFDELGLELSPLEVEVAEMLINVKDGKKPFYDYVPYNRAIHGTPLDYLKKYYGKYLKAFNRDDDYLYQDQLEIIDSKFRNNLRTWLKRDEQDINDYVPTKSVRLDKQAKALKENPEIRKVRVTDSMVKFYKMDNLRKTKRL